ncbi:hypothetical protein [Bacillus sp. SN10]|uniref:hypothetical protein n=1 Tax=Bacillus sp. SN10 TaxID=2056493 RepID=UPI000C31C53B|nr:hypothetical protein [Bacillus sp. SN10]PKJ52649.1 hypothetical protein CWE34_26370 [Bacillus sp. SN10]
MKLFIAVDKQTHEVLAGAKGQGAFFDKNTLARSMGQAGNLKGTYSVVEFDPTTIMPRKDEPKPFVVDIVEGTNWNQEGRMEFSCPNGGFSIGSLSECPEDATLERDLSFVYSIAGYMRGAYEAGKRGDAFIVNYTDEDEEE